MSEYKFETLQLHVGQENPDPATDARAVPIYATTSYVFKNSAHAAARFGLADAGNIYGRLTNSTQDVLEQRVAALEGGVAALALASGAAAITYTLEALGQNGGHFVAQKTIYGGSYNLLAHTLPNFGITASFVNIHDLTKMKNYRVPKYRRELGVVFQDFQLFSCNVGENVALSDIHDSEKVKEALKHSGFSKELKNGTDSELLREFDNEGVMLSGGESQKVAIARAFYKNCPYVILDEPSANLDPIEALRYE